jgi:hypothetical protein
MREISQNFRAIYIDSVKQFTYLGIVFNSSGSFTMARKEILNKGMKALLKFRKIFSLENKFAELSVVFFLLIYYLFHFSKIGLDSL